MLFRTENFIMKDKYLLTVLVSFYNAEKHIASCIKNLKNQSFPDFLVILIDDGSTDSGYLSAVKEIDEDKRFSIIRHETNKGLGAGRETGIRNTQTQFVTFLDIDDEFDNTAAEKIINNIQKQDADVYIYDYFEKNERQEIKRISGNAKSTDELFITNDKRISHVWHKVYRTSLIKSINTQFYRKITFAEDLWLCVKCFMKSKKTVFIPDAYYYYIYNEYSLVHFRTEKSIYENIEVIKNLLEGNEIISCPALKTYLLNESYHTFGLLIFPNKKNQFQWKKPHFKEWRKINSENTVFIPKSISKFTHLYLNLIIKKKDFLAYILWHILRLKEIINTL